MGNYVSEFTEEELATTKETDDLLWEFVDWDKVPTIVKKRICARRQINMEKSQGSLSFAPGFSIPVLSSAGIGFGV